MATRSPNLRNLDRSRECTVVVLPSHGSSPSMPSSGSGGVTTVSASAPRLRLRAGQRRPRHQGVATRTSSTRCAIPNSRRTASRISGGTEPPTFFRSPAGGTGALIWALRTAQPSTSHYYGVAMKAFGFLSIIETLLQSHVAESKLAYEFGGLA